MIDTHSHIYSEEYDTDRDKVVTSARLQGVEKVILANVDSSSIARLDHTQKRYPDFCLSAMGLHPTSIGKNHKQELTIIKEQLYSQSYSAVGEIGIDLYWDDTFVSEQIEAFEEQIAWAIDLQLPVIIHIRKAFAEAFASLHKFRNKLPRGVFHCFSGGIQEALHAIELGFMLGVGGVVTFKNSNLSEIIRQVGIENIILETDAPYLAPVPYRGKRNEPKYMAEILSKVAEVFEVSEQEADAITTASAKSLFVID